MPMMYLSHRFQRDLEKNFNVVHWDQRLAGKSFKKAFDAKEIRVSQYLSDAQVVIEYLRQKFNQKQVLLAGHSWGSYLGILLASKHPDLFSAYIGIGQVVDDPQALSLQKNFYKILLSKQKTKKLKTDFQKALPGMNIISSNMELN